MSTQPHTLEFLTTWLVNEGFSANPQLKLLLGDGSTRCFYRVTDSKNKDSYILISDPQWQQSKDYPPHQEALFQKKISVPHFYKSDPKAGLLLMQDLGDELLQNRIQSAPEKKSFWLVEATRLLAQLHSKMYPVSNSLPVASRRFDTQKLFEEFCFTFEHLRVQYLGLKNLGEKDLLKVKDFCSELADLKPIVFCHRDYHCRNLLVHQEKLWMIDFQDARLGSPVYDLASLLYDAYCPISDELRSQLVATYKDEVSDLALGNAIQWDSFETDLKKMAYQRTLKAAGSFASFWTRYKKSTHLIYFEPALRLAKSLETGGVISREVAAIFETDTMIAKAHGKQKDH